MRQIHIHVGLLQQPKQNVFNVFPHIPCFGEGCGISHGEGDVQHLCQGLGQKCLAAACGSDQQDVALVQACGGLVGFTLAVPFPGEAFVVVVNGDRHHLLGGVLADHLLIQEALDLLRLGDGGQGGSGRSTSMGSCAGLACLFRPMTGVALIVDQLLIKDLVAEIDALVADVNARTSDQLAHLVLRFSAERALQMGIEFRHRTPGTSDGQLRADRVASLKTQDRQRSVACQPSVMIPSPSELSTTRSINPY